jgi:hypothetical protein
MKKCREIPASSRKSENGGEMLFLPFLKSSKGQFWLFRVSYR